MGPSVPIRWLWGVAGAAVTSLGLCGCADFWDNVTSRNFKVESLWSHPSPLVVLRDSQDANERAEALRHLREPLQFGGTQQDQELVFNILSAVATSDRQPLCRLAAIESLGHFKDPRAVDRLVAAYDQASNFPQIKQTPQDPADLIYSMAPIPPDVPTLIQCQALTALGETGNPAAVTKLVLVLREPPTEGSTKEQQNSLDVRMAAARALGHYHKREAADALVTVLQHDTDVALRESATESLQAMTGKKLPPDAKAWQAVLPPGPKDVDIAVDSKSKVLGLF
jgi:HEAT repeat protein